MKMFRQKLQAPSSWVIAIAVMASSLLVVPISGAAKTKKPRIRENHYYYGAFNRRDPFRSLVSGKFVRENKMTIVDLSQVELVGIVRGEIDRFALLEDDKGFNYIIRVGDRIRGER